MDRTKERVSEIKICSDVRIIKGVLGNTSFLNHKIYGKNGLNPNDRNNYHKNGYTMLEVYLSDLVQDGK